LLIHCIAINTTNPRQVVLLVVIYVLVLLLKLVPLQFNSMASAKDCLKKFGQFRLALELH